jgi:hypothetical protein
MGAASSQDSLHILPVLLCLRLRTVLWLNQSVVTERCFPLTTLLLSSEKQPYGLLAPRGSVLAISLILTEARRLTLCWLFFKYCAAFLQSSTVVIAS